MREIKFRAWDKDLEIMVYQGDDNDSGFFIFPWTHNAPVMQYTGLKDKNGKEIYEGDILSKHDLRDTKLGEINYEVIYYTDYAGFALAGLSDDGTERYISRIGVEFGNTKDLEIIGNIYQNKDLITNR